jgi:hypothetical protein
MKALISIAASGGLGEDGAGCWKTRLLSMADFYSAAEYQHAVDWLTNFPALC